MKCQIIFEKDIKINDLINYVLNKKSIIGRIIILSNNF